MNAGLLTRYSKFGCTASELLEIEFADWVDAASTWPFKLVEKSKKALKRGISVSVSVIRKFSYAPTSKRRLKHENPPRHLQPTEHVVESHSENVLS